MCCMWLIAVLYGMRIVHVCVCVCCVCVCLSVLCVCALRFGTYRVMLCGVLNV